MPHRVIVHRYGLRGEVMILLGLVWVLIGLGTALGASQASEVDTLMHLNVPPGVRAAAWIGTGVASLGGALIPRWSSVALGTLWIMPAVRAGSYLWAWLMYLIPGAPEGLAFGWYALLWYVVMLGFVLYAAHTPAAHATDPDRTNRWGRFRPSKE